MAYVLPNGAEIEVERHDNRRVYDRVEFTDSGMVVGINKQGYQMDCYPREQIVEVNTHTNHLEDEEWW